MESSRKRRKIEGSPLNPSKAHTFPTEIVKAEGLAQRSTPASFRPGRVTTVPSTRHVSSPLNAGPSKSPYLGFRCRHGSLIHVVPQPTAPFTEQQLFTIPWFPQGRFVEEPQQIGSVMGDCTKRGKPLHSSSDIQLLPRAHIPSRSEASGSRSTLQPERGTPKNSISTVSITKQNMTLKKIPLSITNNAWKMNTTQRSCEDPAVDSPNERAPLSSNTGQFTQQDAVGRPKPRYPQRIMEERHEIFHIDKYKCLWCVAIFFFVGIFLTLFLYAFHIVK